MKCTLLSFRNGIDLMYLVRVMCPDNRPLNHSSDHFDNILSCLHYGPHFDFIFHSETHSTLETLSNGPNKILDSYALNESFGCVVF